MSRIVRSLLSHDRKGVVGKPVFSHSLADAAQFHEKDRVILHKQQL
jgi:hypothetical protein